MLVERLKCFVDVREAWVSIGSTAMDCTQTSCVGQRDAVEHSSERRWWVVSVLAAGKKCWHHKGVSAGQLSRHSQTMFVHLLNISNYSYLIFEFTFISLWYLHIGRTVIHWLDNRNKFSLIASLIVQTADLNWARLYQLEFFSVSCALFYWLNTVGLGIVKYILSAKILEIHQFYSSLSYETLGDPAYRQMVRLTKYKRVLAPLNSDHIGLRK